MSRKGFKFEPFPGTLDSLHGVKSSIYHKTSLTLHDMQEVVCLRKEKSMSLIPYIELQKLMH